MGIYLSHLCVHILFPPGEKKWRHYFWFKFIETANQQAYCLSLFRTQNMHVGIATEKKLKMTDYGIQILKVNQDTESKSRFQEENKKV